MFEETFDEWWQGEGQELFSLAAEGVNIYTCSREDIQRVWQASSEVTLREVVNELDHAIVRIQYDRIFRTSNLWEDIGFLVEKWAALRQTVGASTGSPETNASEQSRLHEWGSPHGMPDGWRGRTLGASRKPPKAAEEGK